MFTCLGLILMYNTSCSSNEDDQKEDFSISILGEWTQISATDEEGTKTLYINRCPDVLAILTKTITLTDYYDYSPPCIDFDMSTWQYTITESTLNFTYSNDSSGTAEILKLDASTLIIKYSGDYIIEYERTI